MDVDFRSLFEASPDAYLVVDPDYRIVAVSRAYAEATGKTADSLIGKRIADVGAADPAHAPQSVVTEMERSLAKVFRGGASHHRMDPFACAVPHKIGGGKETRYFDPLNSPVLGPDGSVRFVIHRIEDVTERVRGEQRQRAKDDALRARDAQIEAGEVLSGIAMALAAELDLDRLVQRVTDDATRSCGAQFGAFFYNVTGDRGDHYMLYTISGVPKEAFARFPHPRKTKIFAPTFAGEKVVRFDDVTREPEFGHNAPYHGMPEGHLPVKSYLAVPVVSRNGEVIGGLFFGHAQPGIFTARDEGLVVAIAAHAASAIDNARLFRELQQAVRVRDDFLSIAGHELKTPLTGLLLQVQGLLRQACKTPHVSLERFADRLAKAESQIGRLKHLIDDLLDVSRITAGRLTLQCEEMDLDALATEVVERHRDVASRARTPITVQVTGSCSGRWDRLRLDQVLTNLISNALKYGAGHPVEVEVVADEARVRMSVRDHGIGIGAEDQRRIFERFERAVSNHHYGGLGLGLWIARQIVEQLGGTIRVESEPQRETVFTIDLPRRSEARATA